MQDAIRRAQIAREITAIATRKIAAGMSPDLAISQAGHEYREAQAAEHKRKLDAVVNYLQGKGRAE